jgi:hypothetical protein
MLTVAPLAIVSKVSIQYLFANAHCSSEKLILSETYDHMVFATSDRDVVFAKSCMTLGGIFQKVSVLSDT